MQYEDSAKFIFALVKRARKYYLGVTTITQDVNDFLNNQYGRAIVTNSAIQLLMKQSPAGADVVAQTFNLTQSEKYLLLEAGVGEGIFFAGQKHAAIKIVASYTEDRLITTNPEQLLEIERARKDFEDSFNGAAEAVGVKTAQEREAELKKVKASVDSAGATVISMPEEPVAGAAANVAESSVARRDQENFVASNRPAQAAGDGSVPDLFESVDTEDPANDKKDGEQSAEDAVKAILQKENKG
jgi:hypothetical protein